MPAPDEWTEVTRSPISATNFSRLMHLAPPPLDRSTMSSPTLLPSFCTTAEKRSMKFLRSSLSRVETRPASMKDSSHWFGDPWADSGLSSEDGREEDEDELTFPGSNSRNSTLPGCKSDNISKQRAFNQSMLRVEELQIKRGERIRTGELPACIKLSLKTICKIASRPAVAISLLSFLFTILSSIPDICLPDSNVSTRTLSETYGRTGWGKVTLPLKGLMTSEDERAAKNEVMLGI